MENKQLATVENSSLALSAVEVQQQVQAIQQVMKAVMQKDTHYGTVPGCGDKPTLLKAGAEKIMMTFRLGVDPEVEDLSSPDCLRYRVRARIFNIQTGNTSGYGVGEASTDETKYKWRGAIGKEFEATDPIRRRIKYGRDYESQQVRTEIADQANTVLKMAKKRALVDGILTVTASSDIFTQDLEDLPEENWPKHQAAESQAPAEGEGFTVLDEPIPADYKEKKAEYKAKGYGCKQIGKEWKWVRYANAPAQAASQPAEAPVPGAAAPETPEASTKLSESVINQATDMMNEMEWKAIIQKARFQWGASVGDKVFLDKITADYQAFLASKRQG